MTALSNFPEGVDSSDFNNSLVSIIIPFFNQGKFILETLENVLHQEYENCEIIIINDGSNDTHSISVLNQIEDPKINIIHIPNQGVCGARNMGVRHANGKYLLFLDADDKISTAYIKDAVHILETRPDIKVVSCKVELFGEKRGEMNLPDFSLDLLIARNILVISCLFRAQDYELTGGFNENMKDGFEDWDFWLSLLGKGGKVFKIDKVGFFYRIRNTSRNYSIDPQKMKLLRKQIYLNHQYLYSKIFLDPLESFEYQTVVNSKEFKIGQLIGRPLRQMKRLYTNFTYKS